MDAPSKVGMRGKPLLATTLALCLTLVLPVAAQAESAHFGKAATFPGDGEGDTPPQDAFTPETPKITLGVQLRHVKYGDVIRAAWVAEDAEGAPEDYEIATYDMRVDQGTGEIVAFRLTRPTAGWPKGAYRVDVSCNDEVEFSQHFAVVGHR